MQIEIIIIGLIVFGILITNGYINVNELINDNDSLFQKLKESDWNFLVRTKYGDEANPSVLFYKRIKSGLIVMVLLFLFFINDLTLIKASGAVLGGFLMFKLTYFNLKTYYKKHISEIDQMLPHYLKNIEILIQHYTVPVAIGKSISEAPAVFKPGLETLINEINSGNSTIDPYMNFAKEYPVRDSMRMMRLLYRLSLGSQENKQERLLSFSKSISNLQQKGRETRYKNRLEKMESKTMRMLITTGIGVMILLVLAVLQIMNL